MNNKIAIIGEARVGKSRISAEFCKAKDLVIDKFTGPGSDCTEINIEFQVIKNYNESGIIRFESIGSSLNGIQYEFTEENITRFMKQIKEENKVAGTDEHKPLDPVNDCIKITTAASDWACDVMGNNFSQLYIVDTPGVSGNVKGLNGIENAQVYLFVMRPTNEAYFKETVSKMASTVGGSSVVYVYNLNAAVDDEDDIEKLRLKAKEGISAFVKELFTLKGEKSVIDSSIELLNPEGTVIPMGSFRVDEKENFAERHFKKELGESLRRKLRNEDLETLEMLIKSAFTNSISTNPTYNKDALINYIKEITNTFQIINNGGTTQTGIQKFLANKHDRVKTNDNYIIRNAVNTNLRSILNELYDCYSKLKANNENINKVAQSMQETIIKYCYKKLTVAVKSDSGISEGNHPFEEYPPITMWVEESVIAGSILKEFSKNAHKSSAYINVMKRAGYTSQTWNYVAVPSNCNVKKLEIIEHCGLNSLNCGSDTEVVYNAYNLSLLKLGEYSIYELVISELGLLDNPIDWL